MKIGIVSRIGEFPEEYWEKEFEFARKERISYIEIVLGSKYLSPDYRGYHICRINDLARRSNYLDVNLHPWLNEYVVSDGAVFNLASIDDKIRGRSIETAVKLYKMAQQLNAKLITFHGGFFENFRSYTENLKAARISLEQLNSLFKEVRLCIENMPIKGHYGNLVKELPIEASDLLYLVKDLDNIGITFDIGHANNIGNALDFYDKIKESDKVWNIHLHDNNGDRDDHLPLGKGDIDFKKFLEKLKQNNYKGYFSIELDTWPEFPEDMKRDERIAGLKYLRKLI